MLLRKPALSIFNAVYERDPKVTKVFKEITKELHATINLAPFFTRKWFKPFHSILIAYDAFPSGRAVMYSAATSRIAGKYAHLNARTMFNFDGKTYSVILGDNLVVLAAFTKKNLQVER